MGGLGSSGSPGNLRRSRDPGVTSLPRGLPFWPDPSQLSGVTSRIQLRTLGLLDLRAADETPCQAVLRQPKRLAVLAYLAVSSPLRFHRRDTLMGLFWPDLDQGHARAALRRTLYFLRQSLGDTVLASRGDEEIGVAEELFWCDAAAFEQHLREGRTAAALGLYAGDLLSGFFLRNAPEFEQWLELERVRLRDRAAEATRRLADQAAEAGQPEEALRWAQRRLELTPYDEAGFRQLATLLDRTGDGAAALRAYDTFAGRLRTAYEVEPSPDTRSLIQGIRDRAAAPVTTSVPAASPAPRPEPEEQLIAVLPFTIRGREEFAYLAEGMVDLLSAKLDRAGQIRAVEPRAVLAGGTGEEGAAAARRTGAGSYVQGTILEAGGRLQLTASLIRADGTPVARAEASGPVETGLFDLVDALGRQLLAGVPRGRAGRLARLAALTTTSLSALRAWLEGEHCFRQGRYFEAMDAFQEAVTEDPRFALAYYRLAAVRAAAALPELAREAAGDAALYRTRLGAHDRLLLDAQRAWLSGSAAAAESLYLTITGNYPDDIEAWYLLGDLQIHSNPLRGRSVIEARPAFERVLQLEPSHVGAMTHLVRIAALEGLTAERDALVDRIVRLSPGGDRALPVRALRAFGGGDETQQAAVLQELAQARALTIGIAFADVSLYSGNLAGAARFGQRFLPEIRSPELRALALIVLAHVMLAQGDRLGGQTLLQQAQGLEPAWGLEMRALFAVLPFLPVDPAELGDVQAELEQWDASTASPSMHLAFAAHNEVHQHLRAYLLGLIAVRQNRLAIAAERQAELETMERPRQAEALVRNLGLSLASVLAEAQGDGTTALRLLESTRADTWFQLAATSPFYSQAFDRFRRAGLLQMLGRTGEAAAWYRSMAERSPYELVYREAARAALKGEG